MNESSSYQFNKATSVMDSLLFFQMIVSLQFFNFFMIVSFQVSGRREKEEGNHAGREMRRTKHSFQACQLFSPAICPRIRRKHIYVSHCALFPKVKSKGDFTDGFGGNNFLPDVVAQVSATWKASGTSCSASHQLRMMEIIEALI